MEKEFCLWVDAAAGMEVSKQEGAMASAGLHSAELLLPRQRPTSVQVDATGHLMGSVHKGSKQDEPTKYQGTGAQRGIQRFHHPVSTDTSQEVADTLLKQRGRTPGIWAIVNTKDKLKHPLLNVQCLCGS